MADEVATQVWPVDNGPAGGDPEWTMGVPSGPPPPAFSAFLVLWGVERARELGWTQISTGRLARLAAGDFDALPADPARLPGLDQGA